MTDPIIISLVGICGVLAGSLISFWATKKQIEDSPRYTAIEERRKLLYVQAYHLVRCCKLYKPPDFFREANPLLENILIWGEDETAKAFSKIVEILMKNDNLDWGRDVKPVLTKLVHAIRPDSSISDDDHLPLFRFQDEKTGKIEKLHTMNDFPHCPFCGIHLGISVPGKDAAV